MSVRFTIKREGKKKKRRRKGEIGQTRRRSYEITMASGYYNSRVRGELRGGEEGGEKKGKREAQVFDHTVQASRP